MSSSAVAIIRPEDVVQAHRLGGSEHFARSRRYLRGSGLFTALGSILVPLLARAGRYLFTKGIVNTANRTAQHMQSGQTFLNSLKAGAKDTIHEVATDALRKVSGRGGGGQHKKTRKRRYVSITA